VKRALASVTAGWLDGVGRVLLPPHCVVCGRPLGRWEALCGSCRADLPLIGDRCCPRCGRPLGPYVRVGTVCVACRRLPMAHVTAVAAAGTYEAGLREMVLRFKYRRRRDLTRTLTDLVAEPLRARPWWSDVDLIVPVPIHWRRRWWRGFNQADVLAYDLGRRLGRPVARQALRRVRHTPSHVGLSVAARIQNVAGCMRVRPGVALAGTAVLVVDDVMTTGATLSECARVLRRGGARRVFGAVIAVRHGAPLVRKDLRVPD